MAPNILIVQKEAANTLQMMAEHASPGSKDRYTAYVQAMAGVSESRGAPIIWGWSKLARTFTKTQSSWKKGNRKRCFRSPLASGSMPIRLGDGESG